MTPEKLRLLSKCALLITFIAASGYLKSQISITMIGTALTENFNTLAITGTSSAVPMGWAFSEAGTNANATYNTGTGSSNTGDTYSFGIAASTERALGQVRSGTLISTPGVGFTNNTGTTIMALKISYKGEQWRLGALNRVDRLDFQYSLNATSLTTGTWTDVDALDFTAPVVGPTIGALNGNNVPNFTVLVATIPNLTINTGASFWLRWNDLDATAADDGLAVDSFSIVPCDDPGCAALPLSWLSFNVSKYDDLMTRLQWATTEEFNNAYFEIQRSNDEGRTFEVIGRVEATFNPQQVNRYEYIDRKANAGKNLYRIRQVDFDAQFDYSMIRSFSFSANPLNAMVWPNPVSDAINVRMKDVNEAGKISLYNADGRLLKELGFDGGDIFLKMQVSEFMPGVYTMLIQQGVDVQMEKILIK